METVWACWTQPDHITQWNFASDDWECPKATNDLRISGKFSYTMGARDKSASFDFGGTYTEVKSNELIEYVLGDNRRVKIIFTQMPDGIKVSETFEMENENSRERQQFGWQSILDNFKKHTESLS